MCAYDSLEGLVAITHCECASDLCNRAARRTGRTGGLFPCEFIAVLVVGML